LFEAVGEEPQAANPRSGNAAMAAKILVM
jgi:hypothetical protein